jgi:sugar lactone lactonase YvrE
VAGNTDGTNSNARFNKPCGVAVDQAGTLYVADTANATIREIKPVGTNWVVTTIAGVAGLSGTNDGPGNTARFFSPLGIAVDGQAAIFVADSSNHTIRRLAAVGTNWVVSTIAGLASAAGFADGTNSDARFNVPFNVVVDPEGDVFVADTYNQRIRKISQIGMNWVVSTIAGNRLSSSADGTNANAGLNNPRALALDRIGNLYVADAGNETIRRISPSGTNWVTSTVGGLPGRGGADDGLGSAARFVLPSGIAVDREGNLYVSDGENTIRFGEIRFSLQTTALSAQMFLSWPRLATDYIVEMSTSISPNASWIPISEGLITNSTTFVLTNNMVAPEGFYRLRKQ